MFSERVDTVIVRGVFVQAGVDQSDRGRVRLARGREGFGAPGCIQAFMIKLLSKEGVLVMDMGFKRVGIFLTS